ncbi:MAG: hypothetical protein M1816_004651 [Peltula sp. TS41687]|nr:MAG: hypothetical protein M1816_004651 [Peltula sp. TS41687]
MPASRRVSRPAQRGAQSTLSFGTRVTKPSVSSGQSVKKDAALDQDKIKKYASPAPEVEIQRTTAELAIREQAKEEVKKISRTRDEELAAKINDAQLKRYWKERELERKAPRGIARMKRWNRANKLNLHPPLEVLAVLLREEGKGDLKSERASVDELLSSRFVVE